MVMSMDRLTNTAIIIAMIVPTSMSQSAVAAPVEKVTISLEKIGIAFDLPKGYGVFEITDSPHYSIGTELRFGKELRPGHLNSIYGLEMGLWPIGHDGRGIVGGKPSQYIDVEFERVREQVRKQAPGMNEEPEYVKLFGNKAVRYNWYGLNSYTTVVGYRAASKDAPEYLVRILVTHAGREAELLFDAVLNSLRVTK